MKVHLPLRSSLELHLTAQGCLCDDRSSLSHADNKPHIPAHRELRQSVDGSQLALDAAIGHWNPRADQLRLQGSPLQPYKRQGWLVKV